MDGHLAKRWIRAQVSWMLALILAGGSLAQEPPGNALTKFSVGAAIRVRAVDGRKFEGSLEEKRERDFSLRTKKQGTVVLSYGEVRSADAFHGKGSGRKATWIAVGVLAAVVVIGVVFAVRLKNEGAI
jgi:hypothetical protein